MSTKDEQDKPSGGTRNELTGIVSTAEKNDVELRNELINLAEQLKFAISEEEGNLNNLVGRKEEIWKLWNSEKEKLVVCAKLIHIEERQLLQSATVEASVVELNHAESIEKWKRHIREILHRNQQEVAAERVKIDGNLTSSRLEKLNSIAQCQSAINFMKYIEKEKESCHCELLRNLRERYGGQIVNLRKDFQQRRLEMIKRSNQEIKAMQDDLEEKIKTQLQSAEQEKDAKAESEIELSRVNLSHLALYYKNIVMNNIDLLKTLKEQVVEARQDRQEESIFLSKVKKGHAKRAKPMESFQNEVAMLSKHLETDEDERKELLILKSELSDLNSRFEELKWQHELLLQSLQLAQKERDAYKTTFLSSIYKSQQQNELRNLLLEKTLLGLLEKGEQQTATLSNVLLHGNFDSDSVKNIQSQITNVLQLKADHVSNLDGKLGKARQIKENLENVIRTHVKEIAG